MSIYSSMSNCRTWFTINTRDNVDKVFLWSFFPCISTNSKRALETSETKPHYWNTRVLSRSGMFLKGTAVTLSVRIETPQHKMSFLRCPVRITAKPCLLVCSQTTQASTTTLPPNYKQLSFKLFLNANSEPLLLLQFCVLGFFFFYTMRKFSSLVPTHSSSDA